MGRLGAKRNNVVSKSEIEIQRTETYLVKGLLLAIKAYQYVLSPWLGPSCRYLPTCSEYALEAIKVHGLWWGGWLALRRLSRCHPLGASGLDPVPATRDAIPPAQHLGERNE